MTPSPKKWSCPPLFSPKTFLFSKKLIQKMFKTLFPIRRIIFITLVIGYHDHDPTNL